MRDNIDSDIIQIGDVQISLTRIMHDIANFDVTDEQVARCLAPILAKIEAGEFSQRKGTYYERPRKFEPNVTEEQIERVMAPVRKRIESGEFSPPQKKANCI